MAAESTDKSLGSCPVASFGLIDCRKLGQFADAARSAPAGCQYVAGQKEFEQKIELLWARSISYEYRLRAIEKHTSETDITDEMF